MDSPLSALVGQLTWHVRRGIGSFLTMEFGEPHLSVLGPYPAKGQISERSARMLKRRRVFVVGDWHLWIEHADWKLVTANGALDSEDEIGTPKDERLDDLDGQKLLSVDVAAAANRWTLKFDLGAVLEVWPTTYEARELWSLHGWDGRIVVCQTDGAFDHSN